MKFFKKKKYSIMMTMSKYVFVAIIAFAIIMPTYFVGAATGTTPGVKITTTIANPLSQSISDIPTLIAAILYIVLVIGVPIVAIAIVYSGFLFVIAQGNPEKITKARKAIMYTLIGGALLLGSWLIANAIGRTINDIKSTT